MLIEITDPDDPRIAPYRDVKDRDLVGRQGLFMAEGEVVLRVLSRSAFFRPVSLLLAEKRAAGLSEVIGGLDPNVPVYVAAQGVIDAIAGFHLHRGILALAERTAAPDARALLSGLPDGALVVGLVGVSNHDNMGGVFRNAAAFGADAVLIDATSCDPLYRKAIRVSVGGVLVTPFARGAAEEDMVSLLDAAGFDVLALSPSGEARLQEVRRGPRTAVLFGAEGPGLPQGLLSRARSVRIDMAAGFDSLNVATTSGIVLHQLSLADDRRRKPT